MSFQHITWSIICLAGCLSGCTDKSKSPPAAEKPPAQASNTVTEEPEKTAEARIPVGINTLEGFDADVMHYSDQGSGFFPMSVVRALNDSKTGRPFLENLERFGLVPGQKSSRNPEGFPVGIVTNKIKSGEREIEMFGFTCAACHTSDLHYKGQVVRVEGGAGLFYVDQLGDAIADSLTATLKDPEETWAFLQRLTKESKVAGSLIQKFAKLKDLEADGELGRAVAGRNGGRGWPVPRWHWRWPPAAIRSRRARPTSGASSTASPRAICARPRWPWPARPPTAPCPRAG
jgi:hypothetical protein